MDNYWCHSAIISTIPASSDAKEQEKESTSRDLSRDGGLENDASGGERRGPTGLAHAMDSLRHSLAVNIAASVGQSANHRRQARVEIQVGLGQSPTSTSRGREKAGHSWTQLLSSTMERDGVEEGGSGEMEEPPQEMPTASASLDVAAEPDAAKMRRSSTPRTRTRTTLAKPGMKFVTFFCDDQKVCATY